MKKILVLLSVILVLSCTSEEDPEIVASAAPILVNRIVETNEDGIIITSTLTYDGIKVVRINSSNGVVANYTYDGNVISTIEYLESDVVFRKKIFEYSSDGRMSVYINIDVTNNTGTRETYTYNSSGSTNISSFTGDATTQITPNGFATITFSSGEVVNIDSSFSDSHSYSYDEKNNPFQNILGMDKISFAGAEARGIFHNITIDDSDLADTTILYEYNDDTAFPHTATKNTNGLITTTKYFYD